MTACAPGKVNLCLYLGGRRDDGRHELVTLIDSVSLADVLELTTREPGGPDEVVCPAVEGTNLAGRALDALRERGWEAPPVELRIDKRIPIAAGMGGGSADAAATLRLAVEIAPGRPEEVAEIAAELGTDVPSQLVPGLTLGTGAGEQVESLVGLGARAYVILPQSFTLSTPEVYAEADRLGLGSDASTLERRRQALERALHPDVRLADELLVNDLEPAAISLCPAIADALVAARDAGADRGMVSGSGPTVVGLFWGADGPERAAAAAQQLAGRFTNATSAVPVSVEFGLPRFAH